MFLVSHLFSAYLRVSYTVALSLESLAVSPWDLTDAGERAVCCAAAPRAAGGGVIPAGSGGLRGRVPASGEGLLLYPRRSFCPRPSQGKGENGETTEKPSSFLSIRAWAAEGKQKGMSYKC